MGGLAWTAGAKAATQILTWGSMLATVRILSPADYGLGAMAGIVNNLANVLAEFGLGSAVLHMPHLDRKALGQLHAVSCIICTLVFAVAACASPLVSAFFHNGNPLFFMVANTGIFITGFQAVPVGLLQRDMDYRRLSVMEASMVAVQGVVTLVTALMGWGPWALVAGAGAGKLTAATLVCVWKPTPFAWPRWKDIETPFRMGRQLAVGRLAWSLYTQADGIVIGRVLGNAVLGVYGKAMELAAAPADKVSTLLMRTAAPLFANVMDDKPLVRRYYLILLEALTMVVLPLMAGLAMVSKEAVSVVLGARWAGSAEPLAWLGLFMAVRTVSVLSEQVLVSQRRTNLTMRMSILNLCVMPAAFFVAARWLGSWAVAAAWLFLAPLTIFPLLRILAKSIELRPRDFARALAPAVTGSALLCLGVGAVRMWLEPAGWAAAPRLALDVAAGGLVYLTVLFGLFGDRVRRYITFLRDPRQRNATPA